MGGLEKVIAERRQSWALLAGPNFTCPVCFSAFLFRPFLSDLKQLVHHDLLFLAVPRLSLNLIFAKLA
jgi:hypothetical protein